MTVTRRDLIKTTGAAAAAVPIYLSSSAGPAIAAAKTPPKRVAELKDAFNLFDFKRIAKDHIPPSSFAFVSGGAGDEITTTANRESYERLRLRPRVLTDVSELDTTVKLFGQEMPHPVLLAPTGLQREVHADGEIATVKGAADAKATMVVSTYSNTRIEDIGKLAQRPIWFQLYLQKDRGVSRDLVERAQDAGCKAICLTVDSPVAGARNTQARARFAPSFPVENIRGYPIVRTEREARAGSIYHPLLLSRMTWKDVEWLLSISKVPIILKGIMDADDADMAIAIGAKGIVVSNHGGRMLDTVPATIDALPSVADKVAGRVPILIDGGIRRGTDVLKAIGLGANAVMIGRPFLYGLGVAGAAGVTRVVDILDREFRMAMALTGRTSIGKIDRSVIW